MKSRILQWAGIALILETGLLHLYSTPRELSEAGYMGLLFLLNFAGSFLAAWYIFRQKQGGWWLGALIALGSIAGYIQSRTVGMPGMEVEPWFDPIGIIALSVEGLFLLVFLFDRLPTSAALEQRLWPDLSFPEKYVYLPTLALFFLVLSSTVAHQWDIRYARAQQASLHAASRIISAETLEQEYGLKITLVAVTSAGGLVDLRYRVIDPQKAALLLTDESRMPSLLIEGYCLTPSAVSTSPDDTNDGYQSDVMLMSDSHMRTRLLPGRVYFMLFPNQQNIVKPGTPIVVAFGDIHLEPILAK